MLNIVQAVLPWGNNPHFLLLAVGHMIEKLHYALGYRNARSNQFVTIVQAWHVFRGYYTRR